MKIKMSPVRNIINFEVSAHTLANRLDPTNRPRKKSAPPNVTNKANTTTICMNNILFFGKRNARNEKKVRIQPKIVGISDVKDWLSLIKLTTIPQNIKNIP